MAARETRILVLGCVCLYEPLNGYQVRRELLSWGVEEWASVRPGSIYSMLTTLTKDGCVDRHEIPDDGRPVSVYTMTDRGRDVLDDLLREAIQEPQMLQFLTFQSAYAFLPIIDRQDFLAYLHRRRDTLRRQVSHALTHVRGEIESGAVPAHIGRIHDLWVDFATQEETWLEQMISEVQAGAFAFRGDARDWTPPADDPSSP